MEGRPSFGRLRRPPAGKRGPAPTDGRMVCGPTRRARPSVRRVSDMPCPYIPTPPGPGGVCSTSLRGHGGQIRKSRARDTKQRPASPWASAHASPRARQNLPVARGRPHRQIAPSSARQEPPFGVNLYRLWTVEGEDYTPCRCVHRQVIYSPALPGSAGFAMGVALCRG